MNYYNFDVHGMTLSSFSKYLEILLRLIPKDDADVCIIHGYNNGTVLKNYLWNDLEDERIVDIQEFDYGRTIIKLKGEL